LCIGPTVGTSSYSLQKASLGQVFVENYGSNSVTIIEGTKVVKTVGVGKGPQIQITYAANFHEIFVTNSLSGTVSIISALTDKLVKTINGFGEPEAALFLPLNNEIYVADSLRNKVYYLNTSTGQVLGSIHVGSQPMFIAFNPMNNQLYVSDFNSSTVSVIDPTVNKLLTTLSLSSHPQGIAFSPANNETYVAAVFPDRVFAFNLKDKLVSIITGLSGPIDLSYNRSNRDVYVTSFASGIILLNARNKEVSRIAESTPVFNIMYNLHTGLIYVSLPFDDSIQIIKGTTIEDNISVGSWPYGLAYS
jgi:YVTN family beta-propeller protein